MLQLLQVVRSPFGLLERCQARFGDLFTLHPSGTDPWVIVTHPDHLRVVHRGSPDVFYAGTMNAELFGRLTGQSHFVLDGDAHLRQRRMVLPSLHRDAMTGYVDRMATEAEGMVSRWRSGTTLALQPELQRMTLNVIMRVVFGIDERQADARLPRLLVRAADEAIGSPLIIVPALQRDLGRFSPWGRVMAVVRDLDAAILREIERRRGSDNTGDDVFSLLLRATDETGGGLGDAQIRDELKTMLIAGHETTAITLAWIWEQLLRRPDLVERVRDEVREVVADEPIQWKHIRSLRYIEAVITEGMRLRPLAPMLGARRLQAAVELGPYRLPAGTALLMGLHLLQRRPELYPEPRAFRPERFLDSKPDPYAWAPFGGGHRRCLGMSFAMTEMKVVIATMARRTQLRLDAREVRPVRRGLFFAPEHGLRVRVRERGR